MAVLEPSKQMWMDISLGPRPSKEGWGLLHDFLVVVTQHILTLGKPMRTPAQCRYMKIHMTSRMLNTCACNLSMMDACSSMIDCEYIYWSKLHVHCECQDCTGFMTTLLFTEQLWRPFRAWDTSTQPPRTRLLWPRHSYLAETCLCLFPLEVVRAYATDVFL